MQRASKKLGLSYTCALAEEFEHILLGSEVAQSCYRKTLKPFILCNIRIRPPLCTKLSWFKQKALVQCSEVQDTENPKISFKSLGV